MSVNLWSLFEHVAVAAPDREAIVWRDQRLSYESVARKARQLGNVLAEYGFGVQRERSAIAEWEAGQDTVGLYLLNGPEYLIGTLGAYAARTAAYNVNYRYVAEELTYLLDDADTAALIYHARFAPVLETVIPRLRRRPVLLQVADESGIGLLDGAADFEQVLAAASEQLAVTGQSPDDLYVVYTGGTTGMPKGTLWRQADLFDAVLQRPGVIVRDLDGLASLAVAKGAGYRLLPNAPFMHGAAHWLGLRAITSGGTVVINGVVDHLDPKDMWQLVERERVTVTLMAGEAMVRPLVAELEMGSYDVSSLTAVVVGGAMTSPETKSRLLKLLPAGATVVDSAGASETGAVITSVSTREKTAELAVFTPGPTAAVLDAGRTLVLAPGTGEIGWFATHRSIPLGYLGDERKTRETFPVVDGTRWSVPGDRARRRADGSIELLGRDSVTINSGGEKIFAEEVEQAVIAHPAVADVVVVGRASERWGHEVVAVIALHSEATDDDLRAVAGVRIARYKLPKHFVRVASVLRSPSGKADYRWAKSIADHALGNEATLPGYDLHESRI